MTQRERSLAFVTAAAVVLGMLAILFLVIPEPESPPARDAPPTQNGSATPQATIQDSLSPGREAIARDSDSGSAPEPAVAPPTPGSSGGEARRQAVAFVSAFLRYEVGDISPRVRRAIRARADARLAHALLTNPPRASHSGDFPDAARVVRVKDVQPAATGDAAQIVVGIRRRRERSRLTVTVEHERGRWLVTAIG